MLSVNKATIHPNPQVSLRVTPLQSWLATMAKPLQLTLLENLVKFLTSTTMHRVSLLPSACRLYLICIGQVAITPPSANVNYDIYPKGCHGVLGYGVDAPTSDPPNSTLLGVYLP